MPWKNCNWFVVVHMNMLGIAQKTGTSCRSVWCTAKKNTFPKTFCQSEMHCYQMQTDQPGLDIWRQSCTHIGYRRSQTGISFASEPQLLIFIFANSQFLLMNYTNDNAISQYQFFRWFFSFLWINSSTEKRCLPAVNFILIVSWQLQLFLILIHISGKHNSPVSDSAFWKQLT